MKSDGFTLVESMISLALLGCFLLLIMRFSDSRAADSSMVRTISSRDRVLSAVRNLAGMPASLRNSMRAAQPDGVTPLNPELKACIVGTGACNNGATHAFTLFSPTILLDSVTGNPTAIQPITSPDVPVITGGRFDTYGSPCVQPGPNCPLVVTTSFKAQCGPPVFSGAPPTPMTPALLSPTPTCTIADVIEVTYTVKLDDTYATSNPGLQAFLAKVTSSVVTPVKAISGYSPQ